MYVFNLYIRFDSANNNLNKKIKEKKQNVTKDILYGYIHASEVTNYFDCSLLSRFAPQSNIQQNFYFRAITHCTDGD